MPPNTLYYTVRDTMDVTISRRLILPRTIYVNIDVATSRGHAWFGRDTRGRFDGYVHRHAAPSFTARTSRLMLRCRHNVTYAAAAMS